VVVRLVVVVAHRVSYLRLLKEVSNVYFNFLMGLLEAKFLRFNVAFSFKIKLDDSLIA
jgi:hypothetical protein